MQLPTPTPAFAPVLSPEEGGAATAGAAVGDEIEEVKENADDDVWADWSVAGGMPDALEALASLEARAELEAITALEAEDSRVNEDGGVAADAIVENTAATEDATAWDATAVSVNGRADH